MKNARPLLAQVGAVAMALTVALTGCGPTKPETPDGGSTTAQTNEWLPLSTSHQETYLMGSGANSIEDTNSHTTIFERDEQGLVHKKVVVDLTEGAWGTSTTEIASEYTYDDEGWLVSEKRTETTDGADPFETEFEYNYERDAEGRVVRATSSEEGAYSVEFSYDDEGNVIETVKYLNGLDEENNAQTITTTYTADGDVVTKKTVATDEFGEAAYEKTMSYGYEKDARGNVVRQTLTIEGDGAATSDRVSLGESGRTVRETFLPDGSIKAQEVAYSPEGDELLGEEQSYDGPYYTVEQEFDDAGNMLSSRCTYYDGTTESYEATYDDSGKMTAKTCRYADGTERSYEYTYDEHGNTQSEKLVGSTSPKGSTRRLQAEETTFEWVKVSEPAPFVLFNDTYLGW